jgi:branched-chain amino acid transport system permease protein
MMLRTLWDQYSFAISYSIANAVLALSTWLQMTSGMLSFAAVTYAAAGGFTGAQAQVHGLPLVVALIISAVGGAVVGLISSVVLVRLESHWLALATIAMILVTRVIVLNIPDATGGGVGMAVPNAVNLLSLTITLIAVCWVLGRIRGSRLGMAMQAVREDVAVASAMGINVRSIQRTALVLAGAVAGVGGLLTADLLQYIVPETFYMDLAFSIIAAVVLGGAFHWLGAVIGAFVFTIVPVVLQNYISDYAQIGNGLILFAVIMFMPRGLIDPRRRLPWHPKEVAQSAAGGGS